MKSDHKWSLEMQRNARCEPTDPELSACDRIIQERYQCEQFPNETALYINDCVHITTGSHATSQFRYAARVIHGTQQMPPHPPSTFSADVTTVFKDDFHLFIVLLSCLFRLLEEQLCASFCVLTHIASGYTYKYN